MSNQQYAERAGGALSDETLALAGNEGPEECQQTQRTDEADFRSPRAPDQLQALAVLAERLRPAGWVIALGTNPGSFVAMRWGRTVELATVRAAGAFADKVTGKPRWSTDASLVVEGEDYARAYLQRLRDGVAQPDDLWTLLEFLKGEPLKGAARVLEKALLRGVHHA